MLTRRGAPFRQWSKQGREFRFMSRFKRFPLLLVLVLCVVVRLGVLVAFPSIFAFEQTGAIHGDEAYDVYPQNLLKTGEFGRVPGVPDAAFPPLYPYVLAVVYGVFGRGHWQVGLFQILLDVLSIAMLYEIARRLMKHGHALGLLAGTFYALYPYLIFQNLTVIDTPLYITLSFAFLLLVVLMRERPTWDRTLAGLVALSGIVFGLILLARPAFAIFLPFAALWFWFRLPLAQSVGRLFVVGVIGLLVIAPWMVRNYRVFDAFVPMATNGGPNFYIGNSPYTIAFIRAGYHPQFVPIDTGGDPAKAGTNTWLFGASLQYLRDNPGVIPELLWVKFLAYWSIDVFPNKNPGGGTPIIDRNGNVRVVTDAQGNLNLNGVENGDPIVAYSAPLFDQIGRLVHVVYWGSLFLLGIAGLALTASQWREVSLFWFMLIAMTIVYVAIVPATRYRAPTDPLMFLFSAHTLMVLWEAFQRRRQKDLHSGQLTVSTTV